MSDYKNELLFSQFGINYNDLPAVMRKGSIIVKKVVEETMERSPGVFVQKRRKGFAVLHEDLIRDHFWIDHEMGPHDSAGAGMVSRTAPLSPGSPNRDRSSK
jgi:tRNA(His) 5'-end guanylyltransferase